MSTGSKQVVRQMQEKPNQKKNGSLKKQIQLQHINYSTGMQV